MTPSLRFLLLASCLVCTVPVIGDESGLLYLRNNPFSRPEIFNAPPPPVRSVEVIPPEQVELNLTATMVSSGRRLAHVNGVVLRPGDEFQGNKLLRVFEDRAVFLKDGEETTVYVKPELNEDDDQERQSPRRR